MQNFSHITIWSRLRVGSPITFFSTRGGDSLIKLGTSSIFYYASSTNVYKIDPTNILQNTSLFCIFHALSFERNFLFNRRFSLINGTKITISLNKLNNSDNLEDGKPSNTLFTYFVTSSEYFMHFEPQSPQYKKLKNDTIKLSLTLAITDQNNDIITDGPEVTVVLHIR